MPADSLLTKALQEHGTVINNWANQLHIDVRMSFPKTEGTIHLMKKPVNLTNSFYEDYGRLLVYNADSTKFIDFVSYPIIMQRDERGNLVARGGEPDQEVSVIDVRTDSATRVLFFGTCCRVQNAFWYNNEIVGLLGVTEAMNEGHYQPTLWFINTRNGKMVSYESDEEIKATEPNEFLMKTVESKGIKWEG